MLSVHVLSIFEMWTKTYTFFLVLSTVVAVTNGQDEIEGDAEPRVLLIKQQYDNRVDNFLDQAVEYYNGLELLYKAYASYYSRADVDLPGFAKYFKDSSHHMIKHALDLSTYINMRGGFVRFNKPLQIKTWCIDPIDINFKDYGGDVQRRERMLELEPCPEKDSKGKTIEKTQISKAHICRFQQEQVSGEAEKCSLLSREKWRNGLLGLEDALISEKWLNDQLYNGVKKAVDFNDPLTKHHIEHYMLDIERIKWLGDKVERLGSYTSMDDYVLGEYMMDKELNS